MKLNVTANLQFGRGRTFMRGIYGPDNIPKELIAEMRSGSRHISEVDIPNIKQTTTAAKKAAAAKKRKAAAAKKKAADKVTADKVTAEKAAAEKVTADKVQEEK